MSIKGTPYEEVRATTPFSLLLELSKHSEEGVGPDDLIPTHLHERSYKLWNDIVEDYTRASLTKERDKLVAISAIAREMQPLMQSRYLAGLWESNLIQQLGWGNYRSGKSSVYCGPSWSWTSRTSDVLIFNPQDPDWFPLIEVVNAHIDLDGDDEFGPVRAGYLDILGQLFPTKPQTGGDLNRHIELDDEGYAIHEKFFKDTREGPLYCMPLYLDSTYRSLGFISLVLQQCDLPNVYRRVGSVRDRIYPYPTTENACPELLGKFKWPKDTDPTFTRNTTGITSIRLV